MLNASVRLQAVRFAAAVLLLAGTLSLSAGQADPGWQAVAEQAKSGTVHFAEIPAFKNDPVLQKVVLTQAKLSKNAADMVVTGMSTVLGEVEAPTLVANIPERDGGSRYIHSFKLEKFKPSMLWSEMGGTFIDELEIPMLGITQAGVNVFETSDKLPADLVAFFKDVFRNEQFALDLKKGFNLAGPVKLSSGALEKPCKALRLSGDSTILEGFLESNQVNTDKLLTKLTKKPGEQPPPKKSLSQRMHLKAVLPKLNLPKSPSWLESGNLVLEITGNRSIGFGVIMQIKSGAEIVHVACNLLYNKQSSKLDLTGRLEGQWVHPFGIKWLVLDNVVLCLDLGGENVGFGVAGDMNIGPRKLQLAIDSSENFFGSIDKLTLADLATVLETMTGVSEGAQLRHVTIPDIELQNVKVKFAKTSDEDLGVSAGLTLQGTLTSFGRTLADVNAIENNSGITAHGVLGKMTIFPFHLDGAMLDLGVPFSKDASKSHLTLTVNGLDVLGVKQTALIALNARGAHMSVEEKLANLFDCKLVFDADLNGKDAHFGVAGTLKNDFTDFVVKEVTACTERLAKNVDTKLKAAQDKVAADKRSALQAINKKLDDMRATVKGERDAQLKKLKDDQEKVESLTNQIAATRKKVQDANNAASSKLNEAESKVNSLQGQIDDCKHTIKHGALYKRPKAAAELVGLEAAKATADGVLEAVKKTVKFVVVDADPAVAALITAKATAEATLKVTHDSMGWFYKETPVDADPRVAALLTEKAAANAALDTAMASIKVAEGAVEGGAEAAEYIAKKAGAILTVKSASFSASYDNLAKGAALDVNMDLVFLGSQQHLALSGVDLKHVESSIENFTKQLLKNHARK